MNDPRQNNGAFLSLRLARVGSIMIAVPENDIMTIVDWIEPSPLPFAPQSVLGVVSIQGRMFTVLDTARLLEVDLEIQGPIVALRGPEQLALTVDAAGELFQISGDKVRPATDFTSVSKGTMDRDGITVHLVATQNLFAATLQGHERRRRRF